MMSKKTYQAGVKDYQEKYWTPDYVPLDTDLLACFKVTGQPGGDGVDAEFVRAGMQAQLVGPENTGHGGVLDRYDSLLSGAPFFALAYGLMMQ